MKHDSKILLLAVLLTAAMSLHAQDEAPPQASPDSEQADDTPESGDPETTDDVEDEGAPAEDTAQPASGTAKTAGSADAENETPVVPQAELTLNLVVYPAYPPEQAVRVYRPLIEYLNAETPYEINLQTPRNYHTYWLDIGRGEMPDLAIDEAHLAAWRMAEQGYTPLVKPSGPVTFSLLTSADHADDPLSAFVAKRVATLSSPSLGYVILASWFTNPLQQPRIFSTAQTWLDAVEIVFALEAEGAMAPNRLAENYPNLYPVRTSREFPGTTLSIAPELDPEVGRVITEALLVLHDSPDHYTALNELNIDRFQEADPIEYEGLEQYLDSVFAY